MKKQIHCLLEESDAITLGEIAQGNGLTLNMQAKSIIVSFLRKHKKEKKK